jgi:hypothetical protein
MIVEKLNGGKLFESAETFPTLQEVGFENIEDDDYMYSDNEEDMMDDEFSGIPSTSHAAVYNKEEDMMDDDCEVCELGDYDVTGNDDTELSESINKLIEEAKKRKVSETTDLNFLKFLNKSQVDSFYALTNEEQETVKLHINERSYFTQKEVLTLVSEALSTKNETLEERVIRLMPENIKPIWNQLNESSKKSVLSQARLYPEEVLKTEGQVEHFWSTRNLKKNESVTKKLVSHESLIQEDKLSDNEAKSILERFKNL